MKIIKSKFISLANLILLLIALVIFVNFNSIYGKDLLLYFPGIDKPLHFFGSAFFFVLGTYFVKKIFSKFSEKQNIILSSSFVIITSLVHEIYQLNAPYRTFEIMDILANLSGVAFGFSIISYKRISVHYSFIIISLSIGVASILTINTYTELKDYFKGIRLEQQGKYELARKNYDLAYKAGNKQAGLLNSMAWLDIEFLEANIDSAYIYSRMSVEIDSSNSDYLDTFGWVLYHKGKYTEALKYLEKAYADNPDIFCIHYHLGACYYKLEKFDEAVFHLSKQIELNPNDRDGLAAKKSLDNLMKKTVFQANRR